MLAGLGLFVAGILTGVTVLYWACVAACGVAAVLLIAVRRTMGATPAAAVPAAAAETAPDAAADSSAAPVTATARREAGATRSVSGAGEPETAATPPAVDVADPDVEEVEVTDLLLIVDLKDEVLVVDEHPRYHVADCTWLAGRETIPLPVDEARTDGFTPCAVCSPDRTLAERARTRRHAADN